MSDLIMVDEVDTKSLSLREYVEHLEKLVLTNRERIVSIERTQHELIEHIAARAAHETVKQMFSLLDLDIEDSKSIRDFRNNINFAAMAHTTARATVIAFITTVAGLVGTAFWFALRDVFNGK